MGMNASVHTAWGYWGYGRGNTDNTGVTRVMGMNASVHTAWEYR